MRNYTAPNKRIDKWAVAWIYRDNPPNARSVLAQQLCEIRGTLNNQEARKYRDFLLYIGCYPT